MSSESRFRRMLLELDKGLRPGDLDAMKFFCSDLIPVRQREEITRAVKLWEILEERDLLGMNKTDFLKKLLHDAVGAREDLMNIVVHFEENVAPSDTNLLPPGLQEDFDIIIKNINYKKWRSLARKLGFSEDVIDGLADRYHGNIQEQIRQVLMQWSRQENATKELLINALRSCEMNMIAHEIETRV